MDGMKITGNELFFAKTMETAIIPSKREEDAGYDIYVGDRTQTIVIAPNTLGTIDSGIATAYSDNYSTVAFDKSGFGKENIKICGGVYDSGYRGPYYINLANMNSDKYFILSTQNQEEIEKCKYFDLIKKEFTNDYTNDCITKDKCIIKDIKKSVTQILVLPIPKMEVQELSYDELKKIESKRGTGWCGSSRKIKIISPWQIYAMGIFT